MAEAPETLSQTTYSHDTVETVSGNDTADIVREHDTADIVSNNETTNVDDEITSEIHQIDTTDFIQGFINAIQQARFDIVGQQDEADYVDPLNTLQEKFKTDKPVQSFLETSTEIVSKMFGKMVDVGRIKALVRNLSNQFVPLVDLRQEIFTILPCCEQISHERIVSIKDRLSPSALKDIESEITLMGSSMSVIHIIKMRMKEQIQLADPAWLYDGIDAPEKTGCVITHEEEQFLVPFSEYAASQIPGARLLGHLHKIGRIYERDIHIYHPEILLEEYSRNLKKVKESVEDFMKKRRADLLEMGAIALTARFNADRLKYSPEDFVIFPRIFEMNVIVKYFQSGDEDDFDDNMLESHCQILRNIYNGIFINMEFGFILPAIDKAEKFGTQVLSTVLDERVVHEDVD